MSDEVSGWLRDFRLKASFAHVISYLMRHPKERKRLFKKMIAEKEGWKDGTRRGVRANTQEI